MEVNAKISKEWRRRMLFMFCMISGIAAWFLTDGYIIWPNEGQRYEEFVKVREELEAKGKTVEEDSQELKVAWGLYAREAGFSSKIPKERTENSIMGQVVIGWTLAAVSALFAAWIAWNHRLTIRAEGETVIGASGQRVQIDSIIATDRKKWDKKGIAYAIYEEGGEEKRLCLDDHKFKGAEEILLEAERRINARKGEIEKKESDEVSKV